MRPGHWIYTLPLRLRSLLHWGRVEQEMAEELEYHLEMKVREYTASGMTPDEAYYAAMRAMGGLEQQKEKCRDARRVRWISEFLQDSRYAFRMLAKSPGFSAVVVLMLALGIGANTAVISVYETLIFKPLPFGQIDRLVEIPPGFNYPNYLDIRADNTVFSDVAAWMVSSPRGTQRQWTNAVRPGCFLQLFPRGWAAHDAGPGLFAGRRENFGKPACRRISYRLWKDRLWRRSGNCGENDQAQ